MHRRNPEAIIAVTGCYAQLKPQEIAEMTKGDIYDWGKDSAIASRPVHEYKEGAVIKAHDYKVRFASLAEQQVCKAGYRLAKLLNSIFK